MPVCRSGVIFGGRKIPKGPMGISSRRQSKKVTIYMTPAELKRLEAQATKEGVSLSALIMLPWREEGV